MISIAPRALRPKPTAAAGRQRNPPARVVEAVASGEVDVAAVWGPIGGYFAKQSPAPLSVVPIEGTEEFAPLQFRYAIAMGVRKGDHALRAALDAAITKRRAEIRNLLLSYGVPLVTTGG